MFTLALLTVATLAQAQDFTWTGPVASGKTLTIKNIVGDVTVEPATGRDVRVTAVKREGRRGDPEDVEIRRVEDGDGVTICVVYPQSDADDGCDFRGRVRRGDRRNRHWDDNDTRVDFTVRVPAGTKLSANTVSGDVIARGLRGDTEVHSVSGDVRLTDVEGATVEAQTVSGSIELDGVNATELGAETVSGDIDFRGEIRPRGDYDLKTLSGDVVMRIPRGTGAEITGSTFSGDFHSDFSITSRTTSRFTRSQRISGTIGDGSARIRVESFSGDVEVRAREG